MGEIVIRIDQKTGGVVAVEDENGKPLEFIGNIHSEKPEEAQKVRKHLDHVTDGGGRFIKLPVELWEKRGNSVCYIRVNGKVRKYPC